MIIICCIFVQILIYTKKKLFQDKKQKKQNIDNDKNYLSNLTNVFQNFTIEIKIVIISFTNDIQSITCIDWISDEYVITEKSYEYNYKPKIYKPDIVQQHLFLVSFQQYWIKIQGQYQKYLKTKGTTLAVKEKKQRNEQIQLKIKLDQIPACYFHQKYQFVFPQKFNQFSLKRTHDKVAEYLDEIQIQLWNKTSNNPDKYFNCVNNFDETIYMVQNQLKRVQNYRMDCQKNLMQISKSQIKIKKIMQKKKRMEELLGHLQLIKKLFQVKLIQSNSQQKDEIAQKLQILETTKKKQLEICSQIISLKKIVDNMQFYRQQIKQNIYQQFNTEIVTLLGKLLYYDKKSWENTTITPKMLGKQNQTHNNTLDESRFNLTILDQSCFGVSDNYHRDLFENKLSNDEKITYITQSQDEKQIRISVCKLDFIWQMILKYELYDEEQINELIMRELIRHNVRWNKDLKEYLMNLFDQFTSKEIRQQQNSNPILEEIQCEQENCFKESPSPQETSQQVGNTQNCQRALKTNKYLKQITEIRKINELKNLKDLSQFQRKTFGTLKRLGNVLKIGEVLGASVEQSSQTIPQPLSYCRKQQNQIQQEQNKKVKTKTVEQLSKVDTKFFLKAVKFYYEILSSLVRFIKQNEKLTFFHNFLDKFYGFIEQRVKYFFSLRNINEKTPVEDFLVHLNLIEYWCDVCDDVYENLSKLKFTIIDEYLTNLQKNALVNELKKSIDQSTYSPYSINSIHINTFYYVFFWSHIQQIKRQQINNMSLTILKGEITGFAQQLNMKPCDLQNFENELKIIDKKIIYRKQQFFICESFIPFIKLLQKYLQLREILTIFNSNIEQKICEVVGFYVWYNQKNINKSGLNTKSRTLKNLCVIYSNIQFLKIIFNEKLKIGNKKYTKTLDQFEQFFKSLQSNITMTPYLLIEQQISRIYQQNTLNSQFQIPCKQTFKILQIIQSSLEQLKVYFERQKIIKILQPTIKVIIKNYFGYLTSLGKRGLLEVKEFLPKFKQLLLNFGFKKSQSQQSLELTCQTHIFVKQLVEMERNFKSRISQIK